MGEHHANVIDAACGRGQRARMNSPRPSKYQGKMDYTHNIVSATLFQVLGGFWSANYSEP